MKQLAITINFLLLFFFVKGQDIKFIYQEFSPLSSTRSFDDWKHTIVSKSRESEITYYLVEKGRNNSIDELRHEEYKFKYNNIPIEYATIKVHFENDNIRFINGEWFEDESFAGLDVIPSITEENALKRAMEYIGAEQYMWQNKEEYKYLELTEQEHLKNPPRGELIICKNYMDTASKKLSLAYKFDIYATTPLSRDYVYVDAHTGKIIHINARIKHIDGTAATRYSGTRTISTDYYNGSYRLRDNSRGGGIETYNLKKGTSYSDIDFTNATNSWTNFNNTNKDNAALDAHWGAMMTYDYFSKIFGRDSYNNQRAKIKSYVHYGVNYDNAFWNGSVMTYGDGGSKFDALTCLDVVAHEITHAVTEHTANLVYQNESGALSEGISDIFAVGVENYVGGKSFFQLWSIGEDITLQTTAMRYLFSPILGGQPSVYKGALWHTGSSDNGGVHTNSGVFNYWFFLLANGGTGVNQGIPVSVAGIGIEKAEQLVYMCLNSFFTPNTIYPTAALLTTTAALMRFGACSPEVKSVVDAWHAVGINLTVSPYQNNLVITQTVPSNATMAFGAINTIQASNVIQTKANVTYRAGNKITFSSGFKVEAGATFHAYIAPCVTVTQKSFNSSVDNDMEVFQEIADNPTNKFQKDVVLYPNPTKDIVHISFTGKNNDVHLSVYDTMGKELFKQIITDNEYDVDLRSYRTGVYLFKIISNEYNYTFEVVKQ